MATWGISNPFSANVPKYFAMLATYADDQMIIVTEYQMAQTVIYRVNLATGTQKETGLLIPFVVAISGTKFLTTLS